jgi:hypothetical protein
MKVFGWVVFGFEPTPKLKLGWRIHKKRCKNLIPPTYNT